MQDLITGLFLLIENTVQVGDNVVVSGLSGVVENVSIRTMRLRAGDGSVHIVPFSAVTTITNASRGAGNAAVSINVAYKEDTDRANQILKDIVAEMRQVPELPRVDPRRSRIVGRRQGRRRDGRRSSDRSVAPTAAAGPCSASSIAA